VPPRSPNVDQYRLMQVQLSVTLTRDLVHLLRALFQTSDPGPSWQALRTAVAAMIVSRRQLSIGLATSFYRNERLAAGIRTPFTPTVPDPLPEEQVLKTVDATGIGTYTRSLRGGATPQQAMDRAAVTLSGSSTRLALDGGRAVIDQSVQDDDEAIGWIRVTDAAPCPWCLMMASRGAVYHSEQTAGKERNSHFIGDGNFKWHDHCGCIAKPVWDPDDPHLVRADELYDQWSSVTSGHSGQAAVNAWRRYWENQDGDGVSA
jgi:hypothetical protein